MRSLKKLLLPLALVAYVAMAASGLQMADKGLDLTDEGFSLLAARPPSPSATWALPFGWHTAPLFRLVDYDLAQFRIVGSLLLFFAEGLLGAVAIRMGQLLRADASTTSGSRTEVLIGALLAAGLIGASTPTYKWVTVLGATLAAIGLLMVVRSRQSQNVLATSGAGDSSRRSAEEWGGLLLMGFGTFFTVPARPSTPVFFILIAAPLLLAVSDRRTTIRLVAWVSGIAGGFALAALAAGLWSRDAWAILLRFFESPKLLESHGLRGASLELIRVPLDALKDERLVAMILATIVLKVFVSRSVDAQPSSGRPLAFPWIGLGITYAFALAIYRLTPSIVDLVHGLPATGWTGSVMPNRATVPSDAYYPEAQDAMARILAPLMGVTGAAIIASSRRHRVAAAAILTAVLLLGASRPIRFGLFPLSVTVVLVGIILMGVAAGQSDEPRLQARRQTSRITWIGAAGLVLFAVTTWFGTADGLIGGAGGAAGILIAAMLLATSSRPDRRVRLAAWGLTSLLVVTPIAIGRVSSVEASPWRAEPYSSQTVLTPVGQDGSLLYLDPALASLLTSMDATARDAGWRPGTPLLPVASRWSSTIPWHLGARVPESLVLTVGGARQVGRTEVLKYNLSWAVDEDFRSAWILVSGEQHEHRGESWEWAELAANAVGRTFPNDYTKVFATPSSLNTEQIMGYGDVELWRPVPIERQPESANN